MRLSPGLGRLVLLLSVLTPLANSSNVNALPPTNGDLISRNIEARKETPTVAGPKPLAPTKNPSPGTKDAPVDGQDGKPHSGPMIPKDGPPSGNGAGVPPDVGISGGGSSVDITKPPPLTGDHEIVDLEGKEGVGRDIKSDLDPESRLSKSITTEQSDETTKESEGDDNQGHDKSNHDNLDDDDELRGPPVVLKDTDETEEGGTIVSPMHSFTLSFIMILFSEIGDKTFLIAALMAMKHSRLLVFSAALCSLIVMSILSAILGHAVPTLIPKKFTSFLAAGLFLVFGVRMFSEGLKMEKGTEGVKEEMKEVEQELEEKEAAIKHGREGSELRSLEEGGRRGGNNAFPRATLSPSLSDSEDESFKPRRKKSARGFMSLLEGMQNLASLVFSPAWVQTFVMTFLGEWGDRSQIATIAMAAGQDYWWVTMGTICGHSICTAGAVIGGKFLAEKISVRNVTLGGAVAFLVFGAIYFIEALYL
ncbi:hypothetical protein BDZ91DRAFT_694022 [Kalaharituber pfeilii]|nr:hypothetical protein BDZ91DRAFT_694022 [Kalaharituber pfeilii]